MFNDTLKVENKIITKENIEEIAKLLDRMTARYKEINNKETNENNGIPVSEQKWTYKYLSTNNRYRVDYYDSTHIEIENLDVFLTTLNDRIEDIKTVYLYAFSSYSIPVSLNDIKHYTERVSIWFYEEKAYFEFDLNTSLNGFKEAYDYIRDVVDKAPAKYDDVIKNKGRIQFKTSLAIGLIPAMLLCLLTLLVPMLKDIVLRSYILYPIGVLVLAFLIGSFLSGKVSSLYKILIKDQKYYGYDVEKNKSIYVDDIDEYVSKPEILIGKNSNNLKIREEIKRIDEKNSKNLPFYLFILLVVSIVLVVIQVMK